ncbi:MAG TPA: VWA domain-containing protein [Phycisphaerales bacterium]|nr:VWA domain-containing protein [Phycisphaerales bacterium]
MTFVSPWLAGIAAAVAIPTLLLLYFLKLRRRYVRIPSTLLWQRAVVDLQVNTPFQKLRASWLLFLQMLMLVLLLLALAQPRIQSQGRSPERYILLMDVSASMSAKAADGQTRLDVAKTQAKSLIAQASRGVSRPAMMVIAVGASPSIISPWQTNEGITSEAIEILDATDEEANLQAALQLAGSFTGRGEAETVQPPEVVFFSDGSVAPPVNDSSYKLSSGTFTFVQVVNE